LRPAQDAFFVRYAALDGKKIIFIHIFGGFRKPPKIWAFSLRPPALL
jgi:hypothetical protein